MCNLEEFHRGVSILRNIGDDLHICISIPLCTKSSILLQEKKDELLSSLNCGETLAYIYIYVMKNG